MAKGYFNINGTAYYGYDLIYLSARYNNISPYAFIRYDALTSYYNQDDIFCDSTVKDAVMKSAATIKPPQGSKLYLCKPNPYANADVRKCYSITYDVDSADYIVKNPDRLSYVESKLTPEKFQTEFNRKLFVYFSDRIKRGVDLLASVSGDFTQEETAKIYQIINSDSARMANDKTAEENIKVINEEYSKLSPEDAGSASMEDINEELRRLRDSRK